MCLDCLVACPREGGVSLGVARPGPWAEYDPGRREVRHRGGGRGGRGPALRDGRRAGRQAPGPDPSAGRAGRGPLPLPLPALQRVHEGLPDLRPPAHARRGRPGGSLDAGAQVAARLLRLRLHRLRPGLPLRRHPAAAARRASARRCSASRSSTGTAACRGRPARRASSARRCARCRTRPSCCSPSAR